MARRRIGVLAVLVAVLLWCSPRAGAEDFCFQGTVYPADTKSIQVCELTPEEAILLDALPELELVDGRSARNLEGLALLAARRPECQVLYQARVGGELWKPEDTSLRAENGDYALLNALLPCFPNAQHLHLTGRLPERWELMQLRRSFPNLTIDWEVYHNGICWPSDTKTLDFSGQTITADALRGLLNCLPELESVDVRDTGIPQDAMMTLCMEFPGVHFRWVIQAFDMAIPSECTELDFSGVELTDEKPVEDLLYCLPDLQKLEVIGCALDNDTLDALNRRHENVKVVWLVRYGKKFIRTDITRILSRRFSLDSVTTSETAANLRYCPDLITVDLGHTRITDISWVKYTPKLTYLIIGDTPIADISPLAEVSSLKYLEMFGTKVTDYTPLYTCSGLEDLNISYTNGDPAQVLPMTWLKNLWWHMPWIMHTDYEQEWTDLMEHIDERMPGVNVSIRCAGSSTNHGWRQLPNYYAQRDSLGMEYMDG